MTEAIVIQAIAQILSLWKTHQEGGQVTDEELDLVHRLAEQAEDEALGTP